MFRLRRQLLFPLAVTAWRHQHLFIGHRGTALKRGANFNKPLSCMQGLSSENAYGDKTTYSLNVSQVSLSMSATEQNYAFRVVISISQDDNMPWLDRSMRRHHDGMIDLGKCFAFMVGEHASLMSL